MSKKTWPLAAMIATTLSLGSTFSLMAQDIEDGEELLLEEVLVTATKREESIYDVPIAITAFTEAGMERAGITDLTDIVLTFAQVGVFNFIELRGQLIDLGEQSPLSVVVTITDNF